MYAISSFNNMFCFFPNSISTWTFWQDLSSFIIFAQSLTVEYGFAYWKYIILTDKAVTWWTIEAHVRHFVWAKNAT